MTIRRYALIAVLMVVRTYEVHAIAVDEWAPFTQPDGTTFVGHVYGDEIAVNWETADGYAFVYNPADDYLYYAELDNTGDYRPSSAKVGIDDPASNGISKNLQRSAARIAEINAARIAHGYARDPDSPVQGMGASWQWQRRSSAAGAWEAIRSVAASAASAAYPEQSSYRPVSGLAQAVQTIEAINITLTTGPSAKKTDG